MNYGSKKRKTTEAPANITPLTTTTTNTLISNEVHNWKKKLNSQVELKAEKGNPSFPLITVNSRTSQFIQASILFSAYLLTSLIFFLAFLSDSLIPSYYFILLHENENQSLGFIFLCCPESWVES